jgi:hypothetical protein
MEPLEITVLSAGLGFVQPHRTDPGVHEHRVRHDPAADAAALISERGADPPRS